jgi:hypothetical protein
MIGELFINGVLVDLTDSAPFPISYNVGDIKDLSKRKGTSSKTITLPWTQTNLNLFQSVYMFSSSSVGNFDPTIRATAQYYYNSILLFNGYAQLQRCTLNKSFEITLYSEVIDYIQQMNKIKLNELDFSEYNHTLTLQHQVDTWGGTVVLNGVDTNLLNQGKGYYYGLTENGYDRPTNDTFRLTDIPPQLYVYEVLLKLFQRIGITWDSDILETLAVKKMLLCYGGGELPSITQEQADDDSVFCEEVLSLTGSNNGIRSDINDPTQYLFSFEFTQQPIQATVTTDLASQVVTTNPLSIRAKSRGLFQVQYQGEHSFDFDFVPQFTGVLLYSNLLYTVRIQTLRNGSIIATDKVYQGVLSGATMSYSETFNFTYSRDINLEINDVLTFNVILRIGNNSGLFYDYVYFNPSAPNENLSYTYDLQTVLSEINLQKQPQQLTDGGTVYLSAFLPDMTGDVFFKGIINMLNLYVNPNENDPTILEIETLDDFYIDSSDDWTKKIDFKEDVIVTPTINFATRNYLLKFKDDADYWNTRYTTETNKKYGAFNIDSQSQYNNDTTLIELPFSAKCLVDVPNLSDEVTGLVMPSNITIDNGVVKPFKGSPYICYRGALTSGNWIHIDENGDSDENTSYPFIGHTNIRDNATFDLLFGVPDKVYYTVTSYPNNNLYSYHEQSITRIVNKFGKQIECEMWLLPLDVNRLNLRTIKLIDGVKFYIQKISEYDAQQNVNTTVELIKI